VVHVIEPTVILNVMKQGATVIQFDPDILARRQLSLPHALTPAEVVDGAQSSLSLSDIIVLDTGVLGMLVHPAETGEPWECKTWLKLGELSFEK